MFRQFLKGSIFIRVILPLIVMMVPLYLLSFALYSMSTATLRNQVMGNMSSQMDFYLYDLENEIERIRSMQFELMNDEDLNFLANAHIILWDYEKTMAERRAERRLILYKYSSKYILNAQVHIPEMGNTISSEKGMLELSPNYAQILQRLRQGDRRDILMREEAWYLYAVFPPRISYERPPVYVVETTLSRQMIDETLSKAAAVFGGSFAYYAPDDLQFGLRNEQLNQPIIQAFADGPVTSQHVEIPGLGRYLVYRKHSEYLGIDFYAYISEAEAYAPARKIAAIFVTFSLAAVFTLVVFGFQSRKVVHEPVARLVAAFERLEAGDLEVSITPETEDEFRYLYTAFNRMVQSLKSLFNQVTNYEVLTREAQLKQLQAQINPHFLYNCLYIVYRMAQLGDLENVVVFTNHLNTYYRYITRDAREEVPLLNEVEHARNYTAIQQMRFSNRIAVRWGELPANYEALIVPRLILQPLVENAFQHGLKDVESGGWLEIRFEELSNGLRICVENNGACPSGEELEQLQRRISGAEPAGETTALRNIHRRVTMLFGEQSGLVPEVTEEGTFRIGLVLRRETYAEDPGRR